VTSGTYRGHRLRITKSGDTCGDITFEGQGAPVVSGGMLVPSGAGSGSGVAWHLETYYPTAQCQYAKGLVAGRYCLLIFSLTVVARRV